MYEQDMKYKKLRLLYLMYVISNHYIISYQYNDDNYSRCMSTTGIMAQISLNFQISSFAEN